MREPRHLDLRSGANLRQKIRPDILDQLTEFTPPQVYPAGTRLFQQGSVLQEVWSINQGFVKLVRQKDGPVVGVHMIGARMGEQIGEAQLIYNWEALPVDVAQFIHPHPTLTEAIGEAHMKLADRAFHG